MSTTRTDGPIDEARPAAERLAASRQPFLIGVRHHAPSLAAAVPSLLDAARPDVLLVELPYEAAPWLQWLAHQDTRAPIALAGTGRGGLGFYPFADFSPELVALRWAARNGVPAIPCDLPLGHPGWDRTDRTPDAEGTRAATETGAGGLHAALRDRLTGRAGDDLWDRLVEATAPGSTAEAIRRAALTVGWALRRDAGTVDPVDLRREAWMRATLHEATAAGARAAVVLGAFHAPALLEPAVLEPDATAPAAEIADVTMSLIPYTYPLLDARSGYPAGIRDPEWQQRVLESGGDPAALHEALIAAAVRICTDLRGRGHPSGPADAREIVRLAGDLANLRGLPAAGRGELLEAVQTVLTHGEPLGRGRSVARALERVLVGNRAGRPAPAAPRSGLGPEVERRITELGLPGPADPAERDLRLDPLRSDLDRRRELLLQQLTTCRIPYAEPVPVVGAGGADAVTTRWRVRWTPSVAALSDAAGARGVTPEQAAEGTLRAQHRAELDEGGPTAEQILTGLERAAACGLSDLTATRLTETGNTLPTIATLPNLLTALTLTDRIHAGHLGITPGHLGITPTPKSPTPPTADPAPDPKSAADPATAGATLAPVDADPTGTGPAAPAAAPDPKSAARPAIAPDTLDPATRPRAAEDVTQTLLTAAVRHLDGLTGSDDPADARALADLAERADTFGGIRLNTGLARLAADGSPLMSAAAGAVRVLLGHEDPADLGDRIGSWLDTATTPAARADLTRRLTGLLTAAGPLLQTGGPVLAALLDRVDTFADRAFLDRLPALRGGFDTLSPAARDRVLDAVADHLGDRVDTDADPIALAHWTSADLAAHQALAHRSLLPPPTPTTAPAIAPEPASAATPVAGPRRPIDAPDAAIPQPANPTQPVGERAKSQPHQDAPAAIPPPHRWKLILGRRSDHLQGNARHMATALDELYGTGRGEGSRSDLGNGDRGGRQAPYPGVREWSEDLIALFGSDIREEVLAAAAAAGRTDVLTHLDPAAARPSVDLLKTVLAHAGGLPEAKLALLRPLIARIVAELTRELATRLRPALTGITTPRPTRRPGGALDLPRTLRANLGTARRTAEGTVVVVPERPIFRTRSSRSNDWRLILVVDVSGSMEASTIWSALTASILAGVPSLSTHFLAFSTEVVDLTEHVHDPLGLLLEVKVGGGTHIAAGLRAARELVTVPSRTLITVISDFEEGYPVGGLLAEVRTLASSGCHILGCASLDDAGRPRYSTAVAGSLVAAGMPVAALSPTELARWVGEKVR